MAQTRRTDSSIDTLFANNTSGDISPEDLRDGIESGRVHRQAGAPDANDDASGTGGTIFDVGHFILDTTPTVNELYLCEDATATAAVWRRVYPPFSDKSSDDLSTLVNITVNSGSWAIASGVIQATNPGAAVITAEYDPVGLLSAAYEVQIDVRADDADTGWMGIALDAYATGDPSTSGYLARIRQNTDMLTMLIYNGSITIDAVTVPTISQSTWYTLKVQAFGHRVSLAIDDSGPLVTSPYIQPATLAEGGRVKLYAFDLQCSFRNLVIRNFVM